VNFACFVHSAVSDWNHGNAHFLRGLLSALAARGHTVTAWEPRLPWSARNLVKEHGFAPVVEFARAYPEIGVCSYDPADEELLERLEDATRSADVVLVHEWNSPRLVGALGHLRRRGAGWTLLFHDTHHRPWSDPAAIARFNLSAYDGVLAFGEVLRRIYLDRFGTHRAWTLHEAADTRRFRPLERFESDDVVWIGNWGDAERSVELERFWLAAARAHPELRWAAYGVRYPAEAVEALEKAGVDYRGWAASLEVPEIFARSRVTLHIPRQAYVEGLAGIPTIRVFEALACGIPLVSAPWSDAEDLFRPGDYAVGETPAELRSEILRLLGDREAAAEQAARGLETVLARHTCDHRAGELLDIVAELGTCDSSAPPERVAAWS
jgi:spore maturation protein CgeB